MPTDKVIIHVYEPRNRIARSVSIPTHLIYDFDALLAHARLRYPAYSMDDLIRYIWLRGMAACRVAIRAERLPDPSQLPRQEALLEAP